MVNRIYSEVCLPSRSMNVFCLGWGGWGGSSLTNLIPTKGRVFIYLQASFEKALPDHWFSQFLTLRHFVEFQGGGEKYRRVHRLTECNCFSLHFTLKPDFLENSIFFVEVWFLWKFTPVHSSSPVNRSEWFSKDPVKLFSRTQKSNLSSIDPQCRWSSNLFQSGVSIQCFRDSQSLAKRSLYEQRGSCYLCQGGPIQWLKCPNIWNHQTEPT